ncbi:hypothetical protein FHS29_006357 [Saccharothrix tamanrassetensis]|uniref:NIPSNAP domain-containing protein n=1 Tax=Saccharothrix tamanrassetensis TaxID=1051531 RepID=A0A841CWJ2_9PSEU|nr:hypothetical protein [Saccharothrix tamanrassetensis]MBB5959736.1 hypothetical protein [Saccharothrix tamanrassetensis]
MPEDNSIIEVESWNIREGVDPREYHEGMRTWFRWVADRRAELFPEWKAASYYHEVDPATLTPTGRYTLLFEYHSEAERRAYKERRKDWSGPYAEYKKVDPYEPFLDNVTLDFWEPIERGLWLPGRSRS